MEFSENMKCPKCGKTLGGNFFNCDLCMKWNSADTGEQSEKVMRMVKRLQRKKKIVKSCKTCLDSQDGMPSTSMWASCESCILNIHHGNYWKPLKEK